MLLFTKKPVGFKKRGETLRSEVAKVGEEKVSIMVSQVCVDGPNLDELKKTNYITLQVQPSVHHSVISVEAKDFRIHL